MTPDERARRFAAAHHGLVHRTEARRVGLSDRQIRIRVASGAWTRHSTDVFVVNGSPSTHDQQLLAATWRVDGAASFRSAAWVLGLDEPRPGRPQVTPYDGRGGRRSGIVVHQSSDLIRADVATVRSIPTTNATRTILDLAAVTDRRELQLLTERALRMQLTHPDRLVTRFLQLARRGRAGSANARRVLGELDDDLRLIESDLESMLLALIRRAGLPRPTLQHLVEVGGARYRIDLCYPAARLAIEADGFGVHGGRDAFEQDRARQNDLVLAGWRILRFTWRQICREPDWVIDQIRAALFA